MSELQLQFLGGTRTVTGSKALLTHRGRRFLIDCGLFQGFKALRLRNWEPLPVDPASIDTVVLTHAHIDHSGYLPLLVRRGFAGRIVATPATRDLCSILLPDTARLQEEEAAHANRHGWSRHKPALPLYDEAAARACLSRFAPAHFGQRVELAEGLSVQLLPAGHLLGASMALVRVGDRTVLFTGDLGRPNDVLLPPPSRTEGADVLVLESTYGDRQHPHTDPAQELAAVVRRTVARGGAVLVPTFCVGRAQALLHLLARLHASSEIPAVPVFVNSPMASEATAAYLRHPEAHRLGSAEVAALSSLPRFVRTVEESKELCARREPMIVLAGSGMCTGGRVLHHLEAMAPEPRNTVLFVGYQAAGTRGDSIVRGAPEVKMHGAMVPIRAEVASIETLSAHSDADETIAWLERLPEPPRSVLLNHGEPVAASALQGRIERRFGWSCDLAEEGRVLSL